METLENLLVDLENKVKEIDTSINLTFGNSNLMKQQLRHILNCQDHLTKIKLNLDQIIQGTEKNSIFPIIPAAVGSLLTLIGGNITGFGIDLTLGALQQHTSNEEKRKKIRQRCIQLNKKIEYIIQHCDHLKSVANKSFTNSRLMKFLYKKQKLKLFIQNVANILFWFIFFVTVSVLISSFILFLRAEFGFSLGAFMLAITTFLGAGTVANYVEKNDEHWKILIREIAENDHYR